MSICGNLQIYHPKSWLSASLDTVKYLVKFKNSVMPSQDDNCRRDEATYVSKVIFGKYTFILYLPSLNMSKNRKYLLLIQMKYQLDNHGLL